MTHRKASILASISARVSRSPGMTSPLLLRLSITLALCSCSRWYVSRRMLVASSYDMFPEAAPLAPVGFYKIAFAHTLVRWTTKQNTQAIHTHRASARAFAPIGLYSFVGGGGGGVDVAMTRKVARSNRTTSVALHTAANLARCRERTEAFGIRMCTILDQA